MKPLPYYRYQTSDDCICYIDLAIIHELDKKLTSPAFNSAARENHEWHVKVSSDFIITIDGVVLKDRWGTGNPPSPVSEYIGGLP